MIEQQRRPTIEDACRITRLGYYSPGGIMKLFLDAADVAGCISRPAFESVFARICMTGDHEVASQDQIDDLREIARDVCVSLFDVLWDHIYDSIYDLSQGSS